jgi:hypothetical protein
VFHFVFVLGVPLDCFRDDFIFGESLVDRFEPSFSYLCFRVCFVFYRPFTPETAVHGLVQELLDFVTDCLYYLSQTPFIWAPDAARGLPPC